MKRAERIQVQRAQILKLRVEGKSTDQIAEILKMNPRTVRNNLSAAVSLVDATSFLQEMQGVTMTRLEKMLELAWQKAFAMGKYDGDEPDLDWWHACLKVIERQCKLMGMDAPKRIDISVLVAQWAEKNGFDPVDVIEVVGDLFPVPTGYNG